MTSSLIRVCASVALALGCVVMGSMAEAADHRDSPMTANGPFDINDVYAFQSPQRPENVVLIMTVNPFAGVTSDTEFSSRGVYEFNIRNTPSNVGATIAGPNIVFRVYFSASRAGSQRFIVVRENGKPLVSGQSGKITAIAGGGFVTAGLFDDPFFFDNRVLSATNTPPAVDFFGNNNVTAIVLEVPRSMLGPNNISVDCRTLSGARQFDRVGRPAINTVLIVGAARKEAFNKATPAQDRSLFRTEVIARLMFLGNTQAQAEGLADVLLPDVLTIDTSSAAGFLNGRQLADDVIDAELDLLTKTGGALGKVTTDGINTNDKPFLSTFPYLATPHVIAPAAN